MPANSVLSLDLSASYNESEWDGRTPETIVYFFDEEYKTRSRFVVIEKIFYRRTDDNGGCGTSIRNHRIFNAGAPDLLQMRHRIFGIIC